MKVSIIKEGISQIYFKSKQKTLGNRYTKWYSQLVSFCTKQTKDKNKQKKSQRHWDERKERTKLKKWKKNVWGKKGSVAMWICEHYILFKVVFERKAQTLIHFKWIAKPMKHFRIAFLLLCYGASTRRFFFHLFSNFFSPSPRNGCWILTERLECDRTGSWGDFELNVHY